VFKTSVTLIHSINVISSTQPSSLIKPDFTETKDEKKKGSKYITPSVKPFKLTLSNVTKAFTSQGDYQEVIRLPKPIFAYHPANLEALEKFDEQLSELFPELTGISEEELMKISRKRDDSE